jgi:hypothetical protein
MLEILIVFYPVQKPAPFTESQTHDTVYSRLCTVHYIGRAALMQQRIVTLHLQF